MYTKAMVQALGGGEDKEEEGMLGPERTAILAKKAVKRLQAKGVKDPTPKQIVEEMRNVTR